MTRPFRPRAEMRRMGRHRPGDPLELLVELAAARARRARRALGIPVLLAVAAVLALLALGERTARDPAGPPVAGAPATGR